MGRGWEKLGAGRGYGQEAGWDGGTTRGARPGAQHIEGRSTQKDHRAEGHRRRTSRRETEAGKDNDEGEERGNTQGNKRGGVGKRNKEGGPGT